MKKKRNKGQVFIISALVAVLILLGILTIGTYSKKMNRKEIGVNPENFKFEIIQVIMDGKERELEGNQINITEYLDNATYEYLKYAIIQDPNIEIIYVYGNRSGVIVYNFANTNIIVYADSIYVVEGGRIKISGTLNLSEIKEKIISNPQTYMHILPYIRKKLSFVPQKQKITLEIDNINHSISLFQENQFYLIFRTKRGNEILVKIK